MKKEYAKPCISIEKFSEDILIREKSAIDEEYVDLT